MKFDANQMAQDAQDKFYQIAKKKGHDLIDQIAEMSKDPGLIELSRTVEVPVSVLALRLAAVAFGGVIEGKPGITNHEKAALVAMLVEQLNGLALYTRDKR